MINVTNLTNAVNFLEISQGVNEATSNMFFSFLVFSIFIILLIVFSGRMTHKVFAGILFILTILIMLLFVLALIPLWVLILSVLGFVAGVVMLIFGGG